MLGIANSDQFGEFLVSRVTNLDRRLCSIRRGCVVVEVTTTADGEKENDGDDRWPPVRTFTWPRAPSPAYPPLVTLDLINKGHSPTQQPSDWSPLPELTGETGAVGVQLTLRKA